MSLESPNDVEYDSRNTWGPVEKHLRNELISEERREIMKITIVQDPVDQIGLVRCHWKALMMWSMLTLPIWTMRKVVMVHQKGTFSPYYIWSHYPKDLDASLTSAICVNQI